MNAITDKLKEVLFSVLPIVIIVLILNFTITPLETPTLIRFLIGALLIILGLSIFLLGVDLGITPVGNLMGSFLAKSNNVWVVLTAGAILGFFISIAEPDLHILAGQVNFVTSGVISKFSIVAIVSIGIAIMLSLGLFRILFNVPLYKVLTGLYALILGLALFTTPEFLAISFDASGATTGALTVPFILALAMGVSILKKDSKASEKDSFGLVAIASAGAIIAVIVMSIVSRADKITSSLEIDVSSSNSIISPFFNVLPTIMYEVFLALLPLIVVFLVFQKISFKLDKRGFRKILKGFVYAFTGLVFFLVGVNAGFMEVGTTVGYVLASLDNKFYL